MGTIKLKVGDNFRFLENQTLPDYRQEDASIRVARDEIYQVLAVHEIGDQSNKRVLVEAKQKTGKGIIFHQKVGENDNGLEVDIQANDLNSENLKPPLIGDEMKFKLENRLLNQRHSLTLVIPRGKEDQFLSEFAEIMKDRLKIKVINKENFSEELEAFIRAKKQLKNRFPDEIKSMMNTLYVWILPNKFQLTREQKTDFTTMAKYGQYIYLFDHPFELMDLPEPLPEAIGEHSNSHLELALGQ